MNAPHEQPPSPSALELVGEVSDLATGAGIMTFAIAPFAVPFLALTALAVLAILAPMLAGALLAAPCVVAWRRCRSRIHLIRRHHAHPAHRWSGNTSPAGRL
jgi:hypothetical protein